VTSSIVLNANQRRHFEVLFARLEDALVRVETLLGPATGPAPVLSIIDNDLANSFRDYATPILDELRAQVAQLATVLALQPRRLSRSRVIAVTLNSEAIRVQESVSSHLRGYGDVHPSVTQHLDPILTNIAQTLNALATAVRDHGTKP
jgi:hypothetical protein